MPMQPTADVVRMGWDADQYSALSASCQADLGMGDGPAILRPSRNAARAPGRRQIRALRAATRRGCRLEPGHSIKNRLLMYSGACQDGEGEI
jgi:hypothetical protein